MAGAFLSFHSRDEPFVARVSYCLSRCSALDPYFHPAERQGQDWQEQVSGAIDRSDYFLLFVGREIGPWQRAEANFGFERSIGGHLRLIVVILCSGDECDDEGDPGLQMVLANAEKISVHVEDRDADVRCTKEICSSLGVSFHALDDLPTDFVFDYEKDIVSAFVRGSGHLSLSLVRRGCPWTWPEVYRHTEIEDNLRYHANPLDPQRLGAHRDEAAVIQVDARARVDRHGSARPISGGIAGLTFPEAGPREYIALRRGNPTLRIGVLVSGGIAPGINSVIAGIVERYRQYASASGGSECPSFQVEVRGYVEGFKALCRDGGLSTMLSYDEVKAKSTHGGSILPTSRADELVEETSQRERERLLHKILHQLSRDQIDVLHVIGGEGSMRAAHAIWSAYHERHPTGTLSVIGVPKTMDNDILWVWQSFGFMSAVEKARQDIMQLYTEVTSNPRVCIIQLFGSDSGYVVSHAALGSNVCDLVLIPEMRFTVRDVCAYVSDRLEEKWKRIMQTGAPAGSPFGLVVMAETALPVDIEDWLDQDYVGLNDHEKAAIRRFKDNGWRVRGQTPDALRSGGLKVVSRVLHHHIQNEMSIYRKYWSDFRVFTNEPRHLVRSMEPSVTDVAYGFRLGTMAADTAMAGFSDCMVSQWLTEYVAVPLKLVVLGRKRVPRDGIFWKTVVANTGQIARAELT